MYQLYSALLALVLVLGTPYWILEMLRHGKYRKGLRERLGIIPGRIRKSGGGCIWVHAVSVGEVLAVDELVRRLRAEFPEYQLFVSTTTDTGQKLASERFGAEAVFYFPVDFAFAVRSWFRALQPELIVVAETEFWPNFLRTARDSGAHTAIVNARISDRSFPAYKRYKKLLHHVLKNVDTFLAQTSEDARRLVEIGASLERVFVSGNLKYDVPVPSSPAIVEQIRIALKESDAGPVLVCGSTVEGEEPLLLDAFQTALAGYPRAILVLAPRHPQRFEYVAELIQKSKVQFFRRSRWKGESLCGSVLLIDSIGELAGLYALAHIAFVGGSLVPRGGHNILEPAQHGVPILVGKHTENFRDIIGLFQSRNAVRVVEAPELASTVMELLANDTERCALGKRALETLQAQRGATRFTLEKLRSLLSSRSHEVTPA
jgi:3-deoxy-D-manno-octulosonic-acid transferase